MPPMRHPAGTAPPRFYVCLDEQPMSPEPEPALATGRHDPRAGVRINAGGEGGNP